MAIPTLAPRPGRPAAPLPTRPQGLLTHSDAEWTALRPQIERLYIHERRKLKYVMRQMESENSFMASEQMYKKRFMKWGFHKNSKSSPPTVRSSKAKCASKKVSGLSPPPGLSHEDSLALMFLTTVRTWSVSFFESVQTDGGLAQLEPRRSSSRRQRQANTKEMSFAFKLTIDLLDRGHGSWAGRMARKAFILAEDMLLLEGPALIWNLLEIMYNIVTLRHAKLFHMLLAHLTALADGQLPTNHPFHSMMRGLRGLVTGLSRRGTKSKTHSPVVPSLLERAWVLNAEILFEHFNPRLFHLYFHVVCDSCSIGPPASLFAAAGSWFGKIEALQTPANAVEGFFPDTTSGEHIMLRSILNARRDASPPPDYETLQARSLAALWRNGGAALSQGSSYRGDTALLLRILAGLATAKSLEASRIDYPRTKVSRLQAGNLACAIRALMDIRTSSTDSDPGTAMDDIERMRVIAALRAYSEGEAHPQVLLEMWLLRDALVVSGEHGAAEEVGKDVYRRMDKYLQQIPPDYA